MIDLDYLSKLLSILKSNGVSSFEENGLKLYLGIPTISGSTEAFPTQDHTVNLPINEAELPPDLRTDNINSMDTLMNWSTAPQEELPLPGTGEE